MAIGKIKRPIKGDLPSSTQEFISNAEVLNPFDFSSLKKLSLDELVLRYKEIDQQSQLFKGHILLEARRRFKSNIEFGKWLSVNFTELNSSNTGKLINLAKFFQGDKNLDGIPVSAGYLLSSPNNKDIAEKVYNDIKQKQLKLNEIKKIINQYKNIDSSDRKDSEITISNNTTDIEVEEFSSYLLNEVFDGKSKKFIKSVLSVSLSRLNQKK